MTGSLYRIAVLSLWASSARTPRLPHPATRAGHKRRAAPGSAWCWAAAAHAAPRRGKPLRAGRQFICSGTPRATRRRCSGAAASTEQPVCGRCFQTLVSCTPGEAAVLDAVWTVRRAKDGRTATRRTSVHEAVQENGLRCARRRS